MKNAVEMEPGVKIYMPSFMKAGSGNLKLIGRIQRHTDIILIP
jgi:hypothetical protein